MRRFLEELLIIVTILFTLSGTGYTVETGHYVNGLEGIKAATVPGRAQFSVDMRFIAKKAIPMSNREMTSTSNGASARHWQKFGMSDWPVIADGK
jgi:hypothetical protein